MYVIFSQKETNNHDDTPQSSAFDWSDPTKMYWSNEDGEDGWVTLASATIFKDKEGNLPLPPDSEYIYLPDTADELIEWLKTGKDGQPFPSLVEIVKARPHLVVDESDGYIKIIVPDPGPIVVGECRYDGGYGIKPEKWREDAALAPEQREVAFRKVASEWACDYYEGAFIDANTAALVVRILDMLSPDKKEKLLTLPMFKIAEFAWGVAA